MTLKNIIKKHFWKVGILYILFAANFLLIKNYFENESAGKRIIEEFNLYSSQLGDYQLSINDSYIINSRRLYRLQDFFELLMGYNSFYETLEYTRRVLVDSTTLKIVDAKLILSSAKAELDSVVSINYSFVRLPSIQSASDDLDEVVYYYEEMGNSINDTRSFVNSIQDSLKSIVNKLTDIQDKKSNIFRDILNFAILPSFGLIFGNIGLIYYLNLRKRKEKIADETKKE